MTTSSRRARDAERSAAALMPRSDPATLGTSEGTPSGTPAGPWSEGRSGDAGAAPPLIVERLLAVAARHGNAVAVDVPPGHGRPERVRWTYRDLVVAAEGIGGVVDRALGARTADDEPIVAVLLGRDSPWLYAAQIAINGVGAAFTCLDQRFPAEHVRVVLEDASVTVLLTDRAGAAWCAERGISVDHLVDVTDPALAAGEARRLAPPRDGRRLAYLIYTSGTTGRPKGVEIEHRSIANLVDSDVERFGLGVGDRVAQCSSPAYDSSLEETWLAFAVGAALVPLDDDTVRLGPDLVPWLRAEGITVLCPPPTLLRTTGCLEPHLALPALRFLYVGGEALPQDLADRWGRDRWLENGYGPTECTVTVVRDRIRPGEAVTIGRPVRGNRGLVLDEALDEVAEGEAGELCIAGISLARGYRGLPDLTASRFVEHPVHGRIYRTGDLVERRPDGAFLFHGRIDGQVKLRGYRVELGAIEACLAACDGVLEAACRVQGPTTAPILVAHVVPAEPGRLPAIADLRARCQATLPGYMVPARYAFAAALPRSVGGKLDRKALPEIAAGEGERSSTSAGRPPNNDRERQVCAAFAAATHHHDGGAAGVGADEDFFLALGGDSLSAVGVLCALRADPDLAGLAVRDLYQARTAEALALRCDEVARRHRAQSARPSPPHARPEHRSPIGATVVQGAYLVLSIAISGWIWTLLALGLLPWSVERLGVPLAAALVPLAGTVAILVWAPIAVCLVALVQRAVIGRTPPGRVPVWSGPYVRAWIVEQVAKAIPWNVLEGTVAHGWALRVLGARIGRRVHIHRGVALGRGAWDLLSIGDDATLSQESTLHVMDVTEGMLVRAPVSVGAGATIGVRAGVGGGAVVGDGATLGDLAYLTEGASIPAGQRWDGVPASPVGRSAEAPPPRDRGWSPMAHAALLIGGRLAHAGLTGVVVGLATLGWEAIEGMGGAELARWLFSGRLDLGGIAAILVLSLVAVPAALLAQALLLRAMGRVAPGTMSRWGVDAAKVWWKSAAVDAAGRWLSGTMFWPTWLRLAGMRIGRGCEVSTIIDVVPESVTIGDESFFADGIYFCSPRVHRGTITLGATRLGSNTFLGNHAVVPGGATYPDDLFIGVSTVADAARARPGTGWFGHPAMELPRREVVAADRRLTHDPTLVRVVSRAFWEGLRFALPVLPTSLALVWLHLVADLHATAGTATFVLVAVPAATAGLLASMCLAILVLKWALLGRVRPGQHALWSCWCSRWDFLFVAWSMYARALLERLEGTVFLTWFLRAIGMRIGRGVVLGSGFAQVVDPDMLVFEDGATVTCNFQAHTFEDRILKIDRLVIRRDASVGHHTVVFYGADIGAGARVEPHSVVMKQERLEADGVYAGCPAARVE